MRPWYRSAIGTWVPALLLALASAPALAQAPQERSFSPELFHPAPGPDTFITVEPAAPLKHKQWGVGLYLNYARNPLSILTYNDATGGTPSSSAETSSRADIIRNRMAGELWAGVGLIGRLQLALSLPMTLWQNGADFISPNPQPDGTSVRAASGFALGDPRVHLKLRFYGKETGFQIGISHWLGVPIGKDTQFGGEKNYTGFSGEARLLAGWDSERFHVGAFFGFHWRAHSSQFLSTKLGQEITYGGAASIVAIKRWLTVVAELYGVHDFSTNINAGPLEVDVAAKIGVYPGLTVNAGLGNGLIAGAGSPQPRAFLGVVYVPDNIDRDSDGVPDSIDKCPDVPEDRDGFEDRDGCPEPDNDGDTILDREDKCPNEKEDFDDFEDGDGCPDLDNDKDGVPDLTDPCPNDKEDGQPPKPNDGCPQSATDLDGDGIKDDKDKCPNDPEDKDGFEDQDGCPDTDNDSDGIPDEFDQCPNEAEDLDGFEDDDGCPDPDNDKDGVLDKADKCPNEPETINGVQDEDGCPDKGPPSKVKIDRAQVIILEKIAFEGVSARIAPRSHDLLGQVALIIRANARVKIRIEGHTDSQGNVDANVKLSQERAEAVRDYLSAHGVAKERLSAAGYGSAQPVGDNKTAQGREANRRIEFHLVEEPSKKKTTDQPEPEPDSAADQ